MPTIPLDTRRWVKVNPVEDESITVTARGFACFYSTAAEPPEKASEGTELALNSSVTVETQAGRWFRAKEPSATEAPFQPSVLEVTPPSPSGEIDTAELGNEIVTAEKIAKEAVTAVKVKPATVPALAAIKTVKVGTLGGDRCVIANLRGDGGTTLKYKVKHGFKTEALTVSFQSNTGGKPGAQVSNPTEKIEPISEEEIELTFAAGKPANEEVVWVRIEG